MYAMRQLVHAVHRNSEMVTLFAFLLQLIMFLFFVGLMHTGWKEPTFRLHVENYNHERLNPKHISLIHGELMDGCPRQWPLEVFLQHDGSVAYQVCRLLGGTGAWKCATGWEEVRKSSTCKRYNT